MKGKDEDYGGTPQSPLTSGNPHLAIISGAVVPLWSSSASLRYRIEQQECCRRDEEEGLRCLIRGFFSLFSVWFLQKMRFWCSQGCFCPRSFRNGTSSAPFGSASGFDAQAVGSALGFQLYLLLGSSFLLLAPKSSFYFKTKAQRRAETLPFGGGQELGSACWRFARVQSAKGCWSIRASPAQMVSEGALNLLKHRGHGGTFEQCHERKEEADSNTSSGV